LGAWSPQLTDTILWLVNWPVITTNFFYKVEKRGQLKGIWNSGAFSLLTSGRKTAA